MRRTDQVSIWAVDVRRLARTTVLVKHADAVEARAIGIEEASDWVEETHAVAYPLEGRPNDPVWTSEGWLYPEHEFEYEKEG